MHLTYEQLSAITRGADHTLYDEEKGRFVMRRCTDRQTEAYGVGYGTKCELTAGVRFDFWTDSQTVEFDYVIARRVSVIWMSIDLYADGVMVACDHKKSHVSQDKDTFSYRFETAARRRVTVYLPYMLDVQVTDFRLDDGAEVTPYTEYAGTMLCFGDSITHGYHAQYSSCTYPAMVARYFNYDFSNQGNAGYIFDANTIDPEQNIKPDLITVAFGTNDWNKLSSPEEFRENANAFYGRLAEVYPGVPVYGILPLWRGDSWRPKKAGKFEDIRRQLAEIIAANGAIVVDGDQAVPHVDLFFGDYRLHPNDLGFSCYAQYLIGEITRSRA